MSRPRHRHAPDGLILAIACLAQFMVVLDVSIVNVALPRMGQDLHFTLHSIQWVVNAYVLTYAGFLLLGGRAADIFGRRHVYLAGIAVFVLASVLAGFAQSGGQMVAARALQGIGGAILSPATLTIIVTTFQGPRLPKAIGAWSAVAGAGGAVGGLLGGILTGWVSWRWVFFINVPFGLAALVGGVLYLRELRNQEATTKLDVTGAVLVTGSLFAVVYGVVNSATTGWTAPSTSTFIVGGLIGLGLFAFWEQRIASHPIMPFRIFKNRSVASANITMLFTGASFFLLWYFLTFYMQQNLGYGPVKAGFAFLPMAVGIIAGAQISSRNMARLGSRPIAVFATVLATLGYYLLAQLPTTGSYVLHLMIPGVIVAFAMGLLFSPLAQAATWGVDRAEAGLASGLLNTARQLGGSLGLSIVGTIAYDRTKATIHELGPKAAAVAGYHRGYLIVFGAMIVAIGVALTLGRDVGKPVAPGA
jgi:EmrB/QacA subfamily drug resistance transporter